MKRRDFTKGFLTTTLAAPPILGPVSSIAQTNNQQYDENQGNNDSPFVRMELRVLDRLILITWIMILLPTLIGLNYSRSIPRYPYVRLALGAIILSGLTRPLIAKRFANAAFFGYVYLFGAMLFIVPILLGITGLAKMLVVNQEWEFDHPGRLKEVNARGAPTQEQIEKQRRVGRSYIKNKELALVIDPTDTKLPFDIG